MGEKDSENPRVKFDDVLDAFEFTSMVDPYENRAFIRIETGTVHCTRDLEIEPGEIDEEELEASGGLIYLPGKHDLDLGSRLVSAFADQMLSDADADRVRDIFRRKGAYRRFKDFLETRGMLEQWYAFEGKATEQALRKWCEENGIELTASGPPEANA
jgi:hypothetical protein